MIILGIESSCDETAASVVQIDGNRFSVKSNIVSSQIPIHSLYGGVVPEIASRAHCEAISNVVESAINESGTSLSDIDAVAVTFAPGLIGSLLVGVGFAKALASSTGKALIPVDHIKAHVAAAHLEHEFDDQYYLALVVSGGHTSLYEVINNNEYTELGSTRDDACGEAFDKVGRLLGLPYPGGAAMDKLAAEAFDSTDTSYISFPSPAVNDDSYDYSFSGLKTAVLNYINNYKQKNKTDIIPEDVKRQIAGSFTKTICEGISKKLENLIIHSKYKGVKKLILAGGVAANSHLRKAVSSVCIKHKIELIVPSIKYCGDNGAMTAAAGYYNYLEGIKADSYLNAYASDEASHIYLNSLKEKRI